MRSQKIKMRQIRFRPVIRLTRLRADPELARKEPTFELRYQWVWGSVNGRKAPENGSQGRSSRKLIIICSPVMQTM